MQRLKARRAAVDFRDCVRTCVQYESPVRQPTIVFASLAERDLGSLATNL